MLTIPFEMVIAERVINVSKISDILDVEIDVVPTKKNVSDVVYMVIEKITPDEISSLIILKSYFEKNNLERLTIDDLTVNDATIKEKFAFFMRFFFKSAGIVNFRFSVPVKHHYACGETPLDWIAEPDVSKQHGFSLPSNDDIVNVLVLKPHEYEFNDVSSLIRLYIFFKYYRKSYVIGKVEGDKLTIDNTISESEVNQKYLDFLKYARDYIFGGKYNFEKNIKTGRIENTENVAFDKDVLREALYRFEAHGIFTTTTEESTLRHLGNPPYYKINHQSKIRKFWFTWKRFYRAVYTTRPVELKFTSLGEIDAEFKKIPPFKSKESPIKHGIVQVEMGKGGMFPYDCKNTAFPCSYAARVRSKRIDHNLEFFRKIGFNGDDYDTNDYKILIQDGYQINHDTPVTEVITYPYGLEKLDMSQYIALAQLAVIKNYYLDEPILLRVKKVNVTIKNKILEIITDRNITLKFFKDDDQEDD